MYVNFSTGFYPSSLVWSLQVFGICVCLNYTCTFLKKIFYSLSLQPFCLEPQMFTIYNCLNCSFSCLEPQAFGICNCLNCVFFDWFLAFTFCLCPSPPPPLAEHVPFICDSPSLSVKKIIAVFEIFTRHTFIPR